MIRSVLAVLAGIVVLTVASFAIEAVADPLLLRTFPHALPNRAAMSHNLPATLFQLHRCGRVRDGMAGAAIGGAARSDYGCDRSSANRVGDDIVSGRGAATELDCGDGDDRTGGLVWGDRKKDQATSPATELDS
jgi:hypothetical protein